MNITYEILLKILQYDSYQEKKLKAFDRMFIHQNISAVINERPYVLPETTLVKVQEIINTINQLNWESPY